MKTDAKFFPKHDHGMQRKQPVASIGGHEHQRDDGDVMFRTSSRLLLFERSLVLRGAIDRGHKKCECAQ